MVVAGAGVASLIVDRLLGLLIVCWVLGLGLSVLSRSVDHARPVLRGACSTCSGGYGNTENTWAAEGTARRTGAPKRWALARVQSTTKPRKGRLAVAPMSRVHDKADKRVSGK